MASISGLSKLGLPKLSEKMDPEDARALRNYLYQMSPIELVQAILGRLISTTILGIFIAYAYMRTNNVWLPVIIHFLHNSIVMLSLMNFASMEAPNGGVEYWHIIFVYVLILMVFFTPLLFSKVFRSKI